MPERKLYRKVYRKNKMRSQISFLFKFLFFGLVLSLFFLFVIFIFYAKDLPRPEKFTEKHLIESTKIYDRTGKVLLYEIYGEEKRTLVSLDQIPDYLKKAVVATEDVNFYKHFGIDFKGILRSVLINLRIKEPIYGGSTIPQQLIRSTFFSTEKTAERKIREIILAIELDRRYSKDQILEWYLNQVPFGSNSYGVEAASQTYFGKSVQDISLPEAATLAALIQAPSHLSPFGNYKEELLQRKNYVLERMATEGFINKDELDSFKNEEIKFVEKPIQIKAPYFTLWVKQQIEEKYDEDFLRTEGLKIYTSLDWNYQQIAEEALAEGVKRNEFYNAYNGGIVAINPKTGEVLAMSVGTGDYYAKPLPEGCTSGVDCLFDPKFNVVTGTQKSPGRQPGSAFKPFVYATAFKKGYDDKTQVLDAETNFGLWGDKEYSPQNYDGLFRGWVTLRQSLSQSLNVPSIKTLYLIGSENKIENLDINNFLGQEGVLSEGLKESLQTAKDMGITTLDKPLSSYGPALVLGGGEVNLLEMASAYGVFANYGLQIPPVSVLKIEDSKGSIIYENKKELKRVLPSGVAKLIDDILSDNDARTPMFGPRSHLYFENYQVAAKTGTTDNFRDCWTIGFTPSIVVGVWTGNNDNTEMIRKQPAATVAGPIFHQFLEQVLPNYPQEEFEKPDLTTLNWHY
ncbi:MAG: transglycosylase domain-containing protein [Candidatus Pacebacteria bacterium]|nr:transglycosylase domain-containing protein [Candidatus Paceibacterota bacterium]